MNGTQVERVQSCKYLGVTLDVKWSWKPHYLYVFNRVFQMLDDKTRIAIEHLNCLGLPHLDYGDIVWGVQPGFKSEMDRSQAFRKRSPNRIQGHKISWFEALISLQWIPLAGRRFARRCSAVQIAIKGEIPEHLETFTITLRDLHKHHKRNSYNLEFQTRKLNGVKEQVT